MAAAVSRTLQLGLAAGLLLLAGVLLLGLWRVSDSIEHHAYNAGAVPPASYQFTAGKTYEISTRSGDRPATVQCTWSAPGESGQDLRVQPAGDGTRPTHVIATFVAPAGGRLHVACPGAGAVFVDDADNVSFDLAGLFLIGAVIALATGAMTGLAALYRRGAIRPAAAGRTGFPA